MFRPLSTQLVGSYAKPIWLARHSHMMMYDHLWWRPEPEVLQSAKEDAARLSIYDQERAGLDILTDGEAQRENYATHFAGRLGGVDAVQLGNALLSTREIPVPRIVEKITWPGPMGSVRTQILPWQSTHLSALLIP